MWFWHLHFLLSVRTQWLRYPIRTMKCYWFILTLNSFARIMGAFDKIVFECICVIHLHNWTFWGTLTECCIAYFLTYEYWTNIRWRCWHPLWLCAYCSLCVVDELLREPNSQNQKILFSCGESPYCIYSFKLHHWHLFSTFCRIFEWCTQPHFSSLEGKQLCRNIIWPWNCWETKAGQSGNLTKGLSVSSLFCAVSLKH